MRRSPLPLLATFLIFTFSVLGQDRPERCTLNIADAPELRGFKLGMNVIEVQRKVRGGLIVDEDRAVFSPKFLDSSVGQGVRWVALEFLDNKVSMIRVAYDESVKWANSYEFAAAVYEGLKLPHAWKPQAQYLKEAFILPCDGFNVEVIYMGGLPPTVKLYDSNAPLIQEQRKREAEEKERKAFKP